MKYAIEYLKHHKLELDKMVAEADKANWEADREWWAKLSTELETAIERLLLLDVSGSVCKCPICLEEMKGIELTHYKCKKCNEYFTN